MLKFTDHADLFQDLRASLTHSVLKRSRNAQGANSASCAVSLRGRRYFGAKIESDTHVLDISSEQAALLGAIQQRDFAITEVVTLVDGDTGVISPLVMKILVDFGMRTGTMPAYRVLNSSGNIVFETADASRELPFYRPDQQRVGEVDGPVEQNWRAGGTAGEPDGILKAYALRGLALAFPTYAGASSYGAAVRATDGMVYFSGQYSAPDKRLNIHAEVAAIVAALVRGQTDITDIGIISDKFKEEPCSPCGCCRQFIAELSRKFDWDPRIYCFAKEAPVQAAYRIGSLLPHLWSSQRSR